MPFDIWLILIPTIEITILWIVFYRVLVFFEGTRAFQVFKGLSYLLAAFLLSQLLGLGILNWLLTKFFGLSVIALLIIFQPELRQGLARLGQQHLFNVTLAESEQIAVIEDVSSAVCKLSLQKVGCLLAIERGAKLTPYIESGVTLNAKVSAEIIQSIFMPQSPLHDGGVIARGDMIVAASCLFPLSDNPNFSKILGTRHRAALGLTEQTDAVVVMVSEETSDISVAVDGRFIPIVNRERLVNILKDLLVPPQKKKKNERSTQT